MSKIYLFRHAQASIGKADYDVLSTKGEKQALELGKYLCKQKLIFDRVYVGNLQRQKHTQEIVAKQYKRSGLAMPKAFILEGLNEHQATDAMKIEMPNMVNDEYLKSLKKKLFKNPEKNTHL